MRQALRTHRGFTLIEIVVVLAVVAVLAAVMTPAIIKHLNDSRTSRAESEVKTIAAALSSFYKDTGRWPTDTDRNKSITDQEVKLLTSSNGEMPGQENSSIGWTNLSPSDTFDNQIIENRPGGSGGNKYATSGDLSWKGPYLNELKADPWGRKYLCNVGNFHPGRRGPVWVLSAGPDGIVQTKTTRRTLNGDDIGFLLKR